MVEHEGREVPAERVERVDAFAGGRWFKAERTVPTTRTEHHYLVRHLERLALGTPYPAVADRVIAVAKAVRQRTGEAPEIYLDATGVGQPIVDLIASRGAPGRLWPVYFTHGDRRTEEAGRILLGKAFLVSRLQALLQSNCLHLPRTAEAEELGRELLDYEIRVDQDANDRYGAFRVGSHDDLVTALGLATPPPRPVWTAV